jgi:hypothetical protein
MVYSSVRSWFVLSFSGVLELCQGKAPELMKIYLQGLKTLGVKLIEPACADRIVNDKASLFEHLEMLRDCGPAHWEFARKLTNSAGASPEALENGPPSWVAQGVQCLM